MTIPAATTTTPVKKPLLSNELYNGTKFTAQVLLPALATLYFAVAQIWGLPYAVQIIGTLAALDTFLAVLLGISAGQFINAGADGSLVVTNPGTMQESHSLEFTKDLPELASQSQVTLTVKNAGTTSDSVAPTTPAA